MDIATAPVEQTATLYLTGSLVNPLALSLDALRQYPGTTCAPFDAACGIWLA